MKQPKNSLTLILMTSSILLMLVLEIFWLQSAFRNEFTQLRRETNFIFRSTVFALQDSLIQKSIKPLMQGDSTTFRLKTTRHFLDTMVRRENHADNIQIFINSPEGEDSLKTLFMRPLVDRLKKDGTQRRFTIRLGRDTLKKTDIERDFKNALADANISLTFKINTTPFVKKPLPESMTAFATELIPLSPAAHYSAFFDNLQLPVLKKIAPQILFSVFLSTLTIISFIFMYRSIRSQQRLMALKSDFISNITHELKTPIATMSVALEALKNFNGIDNPVRTREYLDIAQYELSRLALLTDKVLNTSIFDERGVKLDLEKINLEKTISEILNSMKLIVEKNNSTIDFQKTGGDFIAEGSNVHLTNVIYNLLDNAIKYSAGQPEIHITLKDLGESISLAISDNGVGIPQEFHGKIFEKFFRMPTGDVHTIKGYGLGLSYVQGVLKAHNGKINVESEPGKGSTFTILLPKKFSNG